MFHVSKTFFAACIAFAALLIMPQSASAFYGSPGETTPVNIGTDGTPYGYEEYLPPGYSETSGVKYPVVIYLHGSGERGDGKYPGNLPNVLANDIGKSLKNKTRVLQAIVLMPQAPNYGSNWWETPKLDQFVDFAFKTYKAADQDRLYMTGLSMGGGGTWDYANYHADRLAAIVPICGAESVNQMTRPATMVDLPMWPFHAMDDGNVSVANTYQIIQLITPPNDNVLDNFNRNAKVDATMIYSRSTQQHTWSYSPTTNIIDSDTRLRMTLYNTGGHGIWTKVYANQDMWNWMFSWKRGGILLSSTDPSPPAANRPPVVNAGSDLTITLPTNSVTLNATATDYDGSIVSTAWSKVSGGAANLITPGSTSLSVTGLVAGVYVFRFTATDNSGASSSDDVQVTVNTAPVVTPPALGSSPDIKIDFGDSVGVTSDWNDAGTNAASSIALKDVNGAATGITLVNTNDLKRVNSNGTSTPNPNLGFPVFATHDTFYGNTVDYNGVLPQMIYEFRGLNPAKQYGFEFFASRMGAGGDNRQTMYTLISGPNSYPLLLNPAENETAKAVTPTPIVPTSSGIIRLTVEKGSANNNAYGFYYLGNIVVKTSDAPSTPANVPPTVNAGADKSITLPTNSVSLTATASDSDGTIASYAWSKLSGGAATLGATNAATLNVSGMTQGSYSFRVTVTDDKGATSSDDVQVFVNAAPNVAPTVNAGADKTITLPTNTVTLTAVASDSDGSIASYAWTKVSGGTANLGAANAAGFSVSGLVQGTYVFRVTVKDNSGATASDDVQVTVNAAPNVAPTVNAGADKTITLPTNSVTLTAAASDSDGTIASYAWTKVSGGTATLGAANAANFTVNGLVQGTYVFRVTVKDNSGATASDDVQVTVNAAPTSPANVPPTVNAGVDKSITLPTNSVTLTAAASDSDGTIASYAWSKVSGGTATMTNVAGATLSLGGLVQGTYVFRVTVKDNKGATATDDVQVVVNPAPVPTVLQVDFGSASNGNAASTAGWNAIYNVAQPPTLLVNSKNVRTEISLAITSRFNAVVATGLASTLFPSFATVDSFYGNTRSFNGGIYNKPTLQLTGLDPTKTYTFEFFASRSKVTGYNLEAQYTVSGANSGSAVLNANENKAAKAIVSGIRPNDDGEITIVVQKGSKNNHSAGQFSLGNMVVRY